MDTAWLESKIESICCQGKLGSSGASPLADNRVAQIATPPIFVTTLSESQFICILPILPDRLVVQQSQDGGILQLSDSEFQLRAPFLGKKSFQDTQRDINWNWYAVRRLTSEK